MNRSECFKMAMERIGGREQEYGAPENNFAFIAELWSIYARHAISALDVAMMMALLKIARVKSGTATDDGFVDLAGYAACAAEISETDGHLHNAKVAAQAHEN